MTSFTLNRKDPGLFAAHVVGIRRGPEARGWYDKTTVCFRELFALAAGSFV